MKYIIIALTLFVLTLSGCGSSRKSEKQVVQDANKEMESSYKIGQVYLGREKCEMYILTEGENQEKLYPVGLDEMFQVDNAILQFEYDLSRAPLPEGCEDCKAVILKSVTRVKR